MNSSSHCFWIKLKQFLGLNGLTNTTIDVFSPSNIGSNHNFRVGDQNNGNKAISEEAVALLH